MSKSMHDRSYIDVDASLTPGEAVKAIVGYHPEDVAVSVVNMRLNQLISDRDGGLFESRGPVDYQGWFWRSIDFFDPDNAAIADGDGRVAFCQNNKWDYPERNLTEEELSTFRDHVWKAYQASRKGGSLEDIQNEVDKHLSAGSDYIASLYVPDNRDWL